MDMSNLTTEAQQLIARKELGTPLQIYSPPTKSTILGGIILLGVMLGFAALIGLALSSVYVFIFFCLLAMLPLLIIGVAISNRKKRAVVCTFGVVVLLPKGSESFRWNDVVTTTRLVAPRGGLTYTVHCHDGRRIVVRDLSHMKDLAETVDVQVAHAQHPVQVDLIQHPRLMS